MARNEKEYKVIRDFLKGWVRLGYSIELTYGVKSSRILRGVGHRSFREMRSTACMLMMLMMTRYGKLHTWAADLHSPLEVFDHTWCYPIDQIAPGQDFFKSGKAEAGKEVDVAKKNGKNRKAVAEKTVAERKRKRKNGSGKTENGSGVKTVAEKR